MEIRNNTILITGGGSGIGLEMVKQFNELGNKILICGRSEEKLRKAQKQFPNIEYRVCDLAFSAQREELAQWVSENHPDCNVLINNAALAHNSDFFSDPEILRKAEMEIQSNFMAPVALSKLLYPILSANLNPSIVNITTGLVYTPKTSYTFYNATKSGLHSFTQVLREQSRKKVLSVIEVLMPVVNTPWHKGKVPKSAISPEAAVKEMIKGLKKGKSEIRIAKVKLLYILSRISPLLAMRIINRS